MEPVHKGGPLSASKEVEVIIFGVLVLIYDSIIEYVIYLCVGCVVTRLG